MLENRFSLSLLTNLESLHFQPELTFHNWQFQRQYLPDVVWIHTQGSHVVGDYFIEHGTIVLGEILLYVDNCCLKESWDVNGDAEDADGKDYFEDIYDDIAAVVFLPVLERSTNRSKSEQEFNI